MENSFLYTPTEALDHFNVLENKGLSQDAVLQSREKYGPNGQYTRSLRILEALRTNQPIALAEDPPTPMWELILEQFKDQLVLILLGSAAVSFILALFEEGDDWTAFVDPAVVCGLSDRPVTTLC